MKLPDIKIPAIDLPFDIPTLLHPAIVHFVVAIPVVILLLELYNVFVRRKSLGAFSFILLLITVVMLAVAYLTGITDGKEAFELLSPEGRTELKEHKLLGTYVLLASGAVLFLRILAMTGKGFFKFLFLIGLIGFIALTLKQGKEGGELVYEHGSNVARITALKDDITDLNEELDEAKEEAAKKQEATTATMVTPTVVPSPETTPAKPVLTQEEQKVEEASSSTPTVGTTTVSTSETTVTESATTEEEKKIEEEKKTEVVQKIEENNITLKTESTATTVETVSQ